jgi:hypothetical protein
MRPICIYHANCLDGFGAAYAVWKRFGDDCDYIPAAYGSAPPDVTGRDVIMVDFSYKRPVLDEMRKTARSMLILDHHKTAEADLKEGDGQDIGKLYPHDWKRHLEAVALDDMENANINGAVIYYIFDMERSGAMLAWNFFHAIESIPPLMIVFIQDRDLWRFKVLGSREACAAIASYPQDFKGWDDIMVLLNNPETGAQILMEGDAILRAQMKDILAMIEASQHTMLIAGYAVPVANMPPMWASEAGNIMAKRERFSATYYDGPKGRAFSLRSDPDGLDVSAIAKQFGGGGHKHAAGFMIPHGDRRLSGIELTP